MIKVFFVCEYMQKFYGGIYIERYGKKGVRR
mgnify:CR=1 FL=1